MKRSVTALLTVGIIASSSFAYHVTSASGISQDTACWDEYNLKGTSKVSTRGSRRGRAGGLHSGGRMLVRVPRIGWSAQELARSVRREAERSLQVGDDAATWLDDCGSDDCGSDDCGSDDCGSDDCGSDDCGSDDCGSDDCGSDDCGSDDCGSDDCGSDDCGSDDCGSDDCGSDAAAPTTAAPTTAAPTTAAPTTAAPTTAAPTTAADRSGPAVSSDQFVETFDGNTGLERFDFGIYHRDPDDSGMVANTQWTGDHDLNCGAGHSAHDPPQQARLNRSTCAEIT